MGHGVRAVAHDDALGDLLTDGDGEDKGLPAYEEVKAHLPGIWKQKQEQTITENLFKELRQNYPITFAEGNQPSRVNPYALEARDEIRRRLEVLGRQRGWFSLISK
jgi:hypothetical protein